MTLIAPQIHDNSTPAERLKENLNEARRAVSNAISNIRWCTPNPRDYSPGLYEQAIEQHASRERRLRELELEIEAEIDAIDAQVNR